METSAIVTFVLIAGIVWGGCALTVTTALRKERDKIADE